MAILFKIKTTKDISNTISRVESLPWRCQHIVQVCSWLLWILRLLVSWYHFRLLLVPCGCLWLLWWLFNPDTPSGPHQQILPWRCSKVSTQGTSWGLLVVAHSAATPSVLEPHQVVASCWCPWLLRWPFKPNIPSQLRPCMRVLPANGKKPNNPRTCRKSVPGLLSLLLHQMPQYQGLQLESVVES